MRKEKRCMRSGNKQMRKTHDLAEKLSHIRGMIDECLALIASERIGPQKRRPPSRAMSHRTLSFDLNERAFIKRHCAGLSSAAKFVLVLAYLARGSESKEVMLSDIKKLWNKMTATTLLGIPFNWKYSTEAKERGWVNSPKQGCYALSKAWKEIFGS